MAKGAKSTGRTLGGQIPQESLKLRLVNTPPVSQQDNTAGPNSEAGDHPQARIVPTPVDPLLTAYEVALRLRVGENRVWDHSSRKIPLLPVIRMGGGALRYRASRIEEFISEQERLSVFRSGRR